MSDSEYISVADTAKLVRQALKENFPGVKFTVRSKTYSGGASISIGWTDGPSSPQVEAVTGKFEGASFDGMIDLKTYIEGEHNGHKVRFGSDYVFYRREYSVAFLTTVVAETCQRWGIKILPSVAQDSTSAYLVTNDALAQPISSNGGGYYNNSIECKIKEAAYNRAA